MKQSITVGKRISGDGEVEIAFKIITAGGVVLVEFDSYEKLDAVLEEAIGSCYGINEKLPKIFEIYFEPKNLQTIKLQRAKYDKFSDDDRQVDFEHIPNYERFYRLFTNEKAINRKIISDSFSADLAVLLYPQMASFDMELMEFFLSYFDEESAKSFLESRPHNKKRQISTDDPDHWCSQLDYYEVISHFYSENENTQIKTHPEKGNLYLTKNKFISFKNNRNRIMHHKVFTPENYDEVCDFFKVYWSETSLKPMLRQAVKNAKDSQARMLKNLQPAINQIVEFNKRPFHYELPTSFHNVVKNLKNLEKPDSED